MRVKRDFDADRLPFLSGARSPSIIEWLDFLSKPEMSNQEPLSVYGGQDLPSLIRSL